MSISVVMIAALLSAQSPVGTSLEEGRVADAVQLAEDALKKDPKDQDSVQLLAALYDAIGDDANAQRVYAMKTATRAPVKPQKEPALEPIKGPVFVNASRLRLREQANANSRVLGELRINDALEVADDGKAAWVKVKLAPAFSDAARRKSFAKTQGYVQRKYLVNKLLDGEALLKDAETAAGAEKVAVLERAALLLPQHQEARTLLVRHALAEKLWTTAAGAAVELARLKKLPLSNLSVATQWKGRVRPGKATMHSSAWTTKGKCFASVRPEYCELVRTRNVALLAPDCAKRKDDDAALKKALASTAMKSLVEGYAKRWKEQLPLKNTRGKVLGHADVDGDGKEDTLVEVSFEGTVGDEDFPYYYERGPGCARVLAVTSDKVFIVGQQECSLDYIHQKLMGVATSPDLPPLIFLETLEMGAGGISAVSWDGAGYSEVFKACFGNG